MTLTVFTGIEDQYYNTISLYSLIACADNLTPELRAVCLAVSDAERDASLYHECKSEYDPSQVEDGEPREIYIRMYAVLSRALYRDHMYVQLNNSIAIIKKAGVL